MLELSQGYSKANVPVCYGSEVNHPQSRRIALQTCFERLGARPRTAMNEEKKESAPKQSLTAFGRHDPTSSKSECLHSIWGRLLIWRL